jgi:WD40 repeat protein
VILRRVAAVLFVPLMLAFGSGVYLYLGTLKSKVVKEHAKLPSVTKPKFQLPGTMFVVQEGRLFKLSAGSFSEIGPAGDWSQPALTPDHTHLVAVLRGGASSDIYLLDLDGQIVKRLTKNDSKILDANHWAYYPKVSPDGSTLFFSIDKPKLVSNAPGVDLSVWSMPLNGSQTQARRWTDPYWYTGGEVSPIAPSTAVHAQIYYQARPFSLGKPLTSAADDCSEPALSPDGTQLAMVCSRGKQTAALEIAPFNGSALGPAQVLLDDGLYASPAWSPDGKAIAYLAPAGDAGHFQLWYLALPQPAPSPTASPSPSPGVSPTATPRPIPTPAPPAPLQVTQGVDLTGTSAPAWY